MQILVIGNKDRFEKYSGLAECAIGFIGFGNLHRIERGEKPENIVWE
jgi:hypothetical protein